MAQSILERKKKQNIDVETLGQKLTRKKKMLGEIFHRWLRFVKQQVAGVMLSFSLTELKVSFFVFSTNLT